MQIISHQQAQRWLHAFSDLDQKQQAALQVHLGACTDCQAYASFIGILTNDLPGAIPSPRLSPREETRRQAEVLEKATRRRSRQRLLTGVRELSWVAIAAVLILTFSWILRVNVPRAIPAGLADVTTTPANTALPATPAPTQQPPDFLPTETQQQMETTLPTATPPAVESTLPTETLLPVETALPTATPIAISNAILLSVSAPSTETAVSPQDLQDGELYFMQRSLGAPFSRILTRAGQTCLQISLSCPAVVVPGQPEMRDAPVSWSPDGSQAVWIDHNGQRLIIYDRLSGEWRTALDGVSASMDIAIWAADGSSFVVTLQGEESQTSLATLVQADVSGQRALAAGLGGLQIPLGWPDANSFLVLVDRPVAKGTDGLPGEPVMVRINLQDGAWTEVPAQGDSAWLNSFPAISPNGQSLALQLPVEGVTQLAVMSMDGQRIQPLGVNGVMPAWSPDGQWLSFITTQNDASQVFIVRPDGSQLQQIFEWPAFPSVLWLPGSQSLVVQTWPAPGALPDSDRSALFLVSLTGGEPLRLTLAAQDGAIELVFPAARPPYQP